MAKIISTIKAILTRIIFSAHSLLAIWQVTENTGDKIYWSLCGPLGVLLLEGIFTLMIKKNQEWRWFCPSVFLYLSSIVPAIWFLELHKVQRHVMGQTELLMNKTDHTVETFQAIGSLLNETGLAASLPPINVDMWTTLIEQFLMLILIVGRWLLPKGDLTRDQLSQLLLVYIGIAADIIEFFESFKDNQIIRIQFLVYLTLGIWSWSLLQFTIVLSATKARRPRGSSSHDRDSNTDCCNDCCCGIEVWGIVLNVILQDAPFLTVRLLIIFHYNIVTYMNLFFTCKNSLVIILQIYRLYVVNAEFWKNRRQLKNPPAKAKHYKSKRRDRIEDANSIYMITSDRNSEMKRKIKRAKDLCDDDFIYMKKLKKDANKKRKRKDTGYSTASSQNLYSTKIVDEKESRRKDKNKKKPKHDHNRPSSEKENIETKKVKKHKKSSGKPDKRKSKKIEAVIEESPSTSSSSSDSSNSTLPSYEVINEKKAKSRRHKRSTSSSSSTSTDGSDTTESSSSSKSS